MYTPNLHGAPNQARDLGAVHADHVHDRRTRRRCAESKQRAGGEGPPGAGFERTVRLPLAGALGHYGCRGDRNGVGAAADRPARLDGLGGPREK